MGARCGHEAAKEKKDAADKAEDGAKAADADAAKDEAAKSERPCGARTGVVRTARVQSEQLVRSVALAWRSSGARVAPEHTRRAPMYT